LRFIGWALSKQKKEEKDKILEFLKRLGLKQAHPYEIIEKLYFTCL